MVKKYLEQQGRKVTDFSQLREGEIYVVVHNKGYIGFVMPKVSIPEHSFVVLNGERVFEVESENDSGKATIIHNYPVDDISVDHEEIGVFRPLEGSELRKTLETHLFSEETELVV